VRRPVGVDLWPAFAIRIVDDLRIGFGRCPDLLGKTKMQQTRHTYGTLALMGGVKPSYISKQMGYVSPAMLFKHYARWIDAAGGGREGDEMNGPYSEFGQILVTGKKYVTISTG
jgi:integrase